MLSLTSKNSGFREQSATVCFYDFKNTQVLFFAANRMNQLPVTLDVQCVYCGVRPEFLRIILL